ncbi:MAG TPA: DNA-binding response regulator [Desulfotomaculum sp.]|nr:MAG: Two component transcriptional regulator, winged helix family [Desulfotomaculum sp. 46_80]HAG10276.1 DNA-binding response regulator [Desulfotomaculum sp.]HBY03320.1 DNA-binding response regulator [Desulfotomaculum sp.]
MAVKRPILLVDDDDRVLELLSLYLKKEDFELVLAHDGKKALEQAKNCNPQLIVLDLMLPEMDGLEVCRQIRTFSKAPIIMLTAKDEDLDKLLGLGLGADDYITKPFNPREVVARIRAVLRRIENTGSEPKVLKFTDLEINLDEYRIIVDSQEVPLTSKEIEILWLLASSPGRVFTREQILARIWGYDFFGDTRTVDTHIKRLRKKLKVRVDLDWDIKTIWGVGYKFEVKPV